MSVVDLDPAQLRALRVTVTEGSLEAAARALHVTPSAISQRLRALEVATGRVLLVRSRPVRPTDSGEVLLRLARQIELLTEDALAELGAGPQDGRTPVLSIAVNADSLATWVLPALAPLSGDVTVDLHREDEEHTAALLRSGAVVAAITTDPDPVPGCAVSRLGVMRYRPTATRDFVRRWFPDGPTAPALAGAPVVVFDRKDDLQHRYLRARLVDPSLPPTHHVPASADFLMAVRLGMGWGMLPDLQVRTAADDALVEIGPAGAIDVELHWQQWKLRSGPLDRVAAAVAVEARRRLAR